MRDTVSLKGQTVNYEHNNYTIEDFCLLPQQGEVYVKLKDIMKKIYLNVPLSLLIITLQQQIKL
jgi:hypothetical protein